MTGDNLQWLTGTVPIEADMYLPVARDRRLRLKPGLITTRMTLQRGDKSPDRHDLLRAWLDIADACGQVFRLERILRGDTILELLRVSAVAHPKVAASPMLSELSVYADTREHLLCVTWVGDGYRPVAYWRGGIELKLDLLVTHDVGPEELLIRIHPAAGVGIGYEDVPETRVCTDKAPLLVLWPTAFGPRRIEVEAMPALQPLEKHVERQALVSVDD